MPFKSNAQRRYMNANAGKIGKKVVSEFNKASSGMSLPERIMKEATKDNMHKVKTAAIKRMLTKI
jgi:hypothetical protein